MYNLTNATNLTLLIGGTNANAFYSTLASVSIVFIIVICTFSIYIASMINETIYRKTEEIENYTLKIYEYDRKNEKMNKIIKSLKPDDRIEDEEKYRRYAQLVTNNNLYKNQFEKKIKENEKLITCNKKRKENLTTPIRLVYVFLLVFMVVPLFFLSSSGNETISSASNVLKIPLLLVFFLNAALIIMTCERILNYDASC